MDVRTILIPSDIKNIVTLANISILASILLCTFFVFRPRDTLRAAKEPPVVISTIPYIGHLFGYIRYGKTYFARLG